MAIQETTPARHNLRADLPVYGKLAGIALLWWAVYSVLLPVSQWLAYSVLGLTRGSHLGDSVAFFLYDVPKILLLLSGMIFPLDAMAAGVRWIGYLLPLTYFTMISQGVMLRGSGWEALWLPILVLAVMAVVLFAAAVVRLHASIASARAARRAPAGAESRLIQSVVAVFRPSASAAGCRLSGCS